MPRSAIAICLGIFSRPAAGVSLGRSLLVLALALVTAGCGPTDPATAKITADDTTAFVRWKRDVATKLPPAVQKQFDTTLAELRLDIQFRQAASGHDGIEAAVSEKLNHLTVNEALLLGAQLKWRRLAGEQADLQRVTNANSRLITKPGDAAAAADLAQYRAKHQARLDAVTAELAGVEKEITALGGNVTALRPTVTATAPTAVTRDEALKQVADMLGGRQGAATVRYGSWPVRIDWDGRLLDEARRAEFQKQKATSALRQRVVIAVRIKGHWMIYEGPDGAPALPDDVRAKLTAAELAAFKHNWLEVEAEIWAREVAKEFPDPAPSPAEEKPDEQPVLLHK